MLAVRECSLLFWLGLPTNNSHQSSPPLPVSDFPIHCPMCTCVYERSGTGQDRREGKQRMSKRMQTMSAGANACIKETWKGTAKWRRGSKAGKPLPHPADGLSLVDGPFELLSGGASEQSIHYTCSLGAIGEPFIRSGVRRCVLHD